MRKLIFIAAAIAFASLTTMAPAVAATAQNTPNSLDALLSRVKAQTHGESELFEQHRAAYAAASAEQRKEMMQQAQTALAKAKADSEDAARRFAEHEVKISSLSKQLEDDISALKLTAVFSLARQAASDVASAFQGSLIATQLEPPEGEPGRLTFLYTLADADGTPTAAQLERLWYEVQRALTAQGKVVRYQAPVVGSDGKQTIQSVLRIGPFTASSNGHFLEYIPQLNILSVLPRALPDNYQSILRDFVHSSKDYARAVVDPSGGGLMALYVNRPTWLDRVHLGGLVGYVIIAIGIIGFVLFLIQLGYLILVRLGVGKQLKNLDHARENNPLGRVLRAHKGDPDQIEEDYELAELRITEAVLHEEPKLTRFQSFLRLAVAAGPLLGLIGTVVGMIITFQTITETGSADPRLMATGIGHAMIATVLGLGIAIPLLFANALLHSLSDGVVQILERQSNGMLAEGIERERERKPNV